MGVLAEDMARLADEIQASRSARKALVKRLRQESKRLGASVTAMREQFQEAHGDTSRRMKAERVAFVSGLKQAVGGVRETVAADIEGARQAWFGARPVAARPAESTEKKPKRPARARQQSSKRRTR